MSMDAPRVMHKAGDVSYYEILDLPLPTMRPTENQPNAKDVKHAYRRALLKHHPDKSKKANSGTQLDELDSEHHSSRYTIDQITRAFEILSDPQKRNDYDRQLSQPARESVKGLQNGSQTTELEVVDLDDMAFDEMKGLWMRTCRCGNQEAFAIKEDDLIDESGVGQGEVLLACPDCSHHVKVLYQVEDG